MGFFRNLPGSIHWLRTSIAVVWGSARVRPKAVRRCLGAPICVGWASSLRVATGGDANWSSEVRRRRSPAHANRRRDFTHWLMKTGNQDREARLDQ